MLPRGLLVCIVALHAVSCASDGSRSPSATRELTGVVVDVDSRALGDVRSFTLRSDGRNQRVFIDPRQDYGFPPSHLSQHLASGDPVRVRLKTSDGKLVARSIEDA